MEFHVMNARMQKKWWKLCISFMLFQILQEHVFHHIKCN